MDTGRSARRVVTLIVSSLCLVSLSIVLQVAVCPASAHAAGYLVAGVWGARGETPGLFLAPKGVAVDGQGNVFVCDYGADRIDVYSLEGRLLRSWGGAGTAPGKLRRPSRLAVGPDGSVYVTDALNRRVQRFSPTGDLLAIIGGGGEGPGRFRCPRGVGVSPDGLVYVTDGLLDRVEVFAPDGRFVRQWGGTGTGPGRFLVPKDVAVGPDGRVYVVDCRRADVQVFTARGKYLGVIGRQGTLPGRFDGPRGVFVGPDGHLFVADAYNDRVQEFTGDGGFVRAWGCRGTLPGQFFGPRDVAVAPDGSLVVTDTHNWRVQRFALSSAQDETVPRTTPNMDRPLVNGWSRLPIKLTLDATDPDDGVAATYLQRRGRTSWFLPFTTPLTLRQGVHVLRFLSVDTAGNQEATRRRVVRVDWTHPNVAPTRLPAQTIRGGRTIVLSLTVADNLSPSCRFVVGVFRQGVLVARVALGRRAVSRRPHAVALAWRCSLRRGDYRLRISVVDAAGNASRRAGDLRVF